jgi:hypothetical protein
MKSTWAIKFQNALYILLSGKLANVYLVYLERRVPRWLSQIVKKCCAIWTFVKNRSFCVFREL